MFSRRSVKAGTLSVGVGGGKGAGRKRTRPSNPGAGPCSATPVATGSAHRGDMEGRRPGRPRLAAPAGVMGEHCSRDTKQEEVSSRHDGERGMRFFASSAAKGRDPQTQQPLGLFSTPQTHVRAPQDQLDHGAMIENK